MANIITRRKAYRSGGNMGKKLLVVEADVVIDTPVNNLSASAFGLTEIVEAGPFVSDDNSTWYPAVPNYAQDGILIRDPNDGAAELIPADTYRVTVKGN